MRVHSPLFTLKCDAFNQAPELSRVFCKKNAGFRTTNEMERMKKKTQDDARIRCVVANANAKRWSIK